MIYTVTLNPAIDYVCQLENFELGKVNRNKNEGVFYGGKGINVAAVLKELGFTSTSLGFIGGFTGEELERGVKEELGLNCDFIKVTQGMTRINIKIKSMIETEINGIGPDVDSEALKKLLLQINNIKSGDFLIISGSVPMTLPKTIYNEILDCLKGKDVKVVVDAAGELLLNTLNYRPFLIKPNNHELAEMFNVELHNIDDIEIYARKLQSMGARNVLISMANNGSILIDESGKKYQIGVCKGTLKNSVGAGDSMVAGFVAGYLMEMSYSEILKLATAAGGATAFSEGLATKEKINELIKQL